MKTTPNKLKIDEEKLFEPYCADDNFRPLLRHPFVAGDLVGATDCHIMLLVQINLLEGKYEAEEGAPHVDEVIGNDNYNGIITLEQLRLCYEAMATEDEEILVSPAVKCDECGGEGLVDWHYESNSGHEYTEKMECPVCHGKGDIRDEVYKKTVRKIPANDCGVSVNGVNLAAYYLMLIMDTMEMLGLDHVTHATCDASLPNKFHLMEGIDIILMPRLPEADLEYTITSPNTK